MNSGLRSTGTRLDIYLIYKLAARGGPSEGHGEGHDYDPTESERSTKFVESCQDPLARKCDF